MANVHVTYMPTRSGSRVPRRPSAAVIARRRRVFLWSVSLLVVAITVLANYGPMSSYLDAKARLEKAERAVAQLEAQQSGLQVELGRLSEAEYLESLARQDLAYTRPGEELYIVTGAGADGGSASSAGYGGTVSDGAPGFLERVLGPLLD